MIISVTILQTCMNSCMLNEIIWIQTFQAKCINEFLFFSCDKNTFNTNICTAYGNKQVLVLLAALYIKQSETHEKTSLRGKKIEC